MTRYFLLLSALITLTLAASAQDSVSVKSDNNRRIGFGVRAGALSNYMYSQKGTRSDYVTHVDDKIGWHVGGVVRFLERQYMNGKASSAFETGLNFADRRYDSNPLYYLELPLMGGYTVDSKILQYRFLLGLYGGIRLSDGDFDHLKRVNFGIAAGIHFVFYRHFVFGTYLNYSAINLNDTDISDLRNTLYSATISLGWDF